MGLEAKYGRITTEHGDIPADEPVFLLRAQDILAAPAIDQYANLRAAAGDVKAADQCREVAAAMRAWPKHKMPD